MGWLGGALFVLAVILFGWILVTYIVPEAQTPQPQTITTSPSIKLASWNLQIFGEKKAADLELMNKYVDMIKQYDVVAIQEIRDNSNTAFPKLCAMLPDYNCVESKRAGTTSSKEQYGVIYKKTVSLSDFVDYTDIYPNLFERPPIRYTVYFNNKLVHVYVIHTKPDHATQEIRNMENVVTATPNSTIVMGDLNADCSYFKRTTEFKDWYWALADDVDTTVSSTDCAYDRIIATHDINVVGGIHGADKEMSDHYLIWAEVN